MSETITQFSEADERMRAALRQLTDIATAAAAEKQHEAKMVSATAASLTVVRQVLEADAKRARFFAWSCACFGSTVAAIATLVAIYSSQFANPAPVIRDARPVESENPKGHLILEAAANKALVESLRDEREKDRRLVEMLLLRLAGNTQQVTNSVQPNPGFETPISAAQEKPDAAPANISKPIQAQRELPGTDSHIVTNKPIELAGRSVVPAIRVAGHIGKPTRMIARGKANEVYLNHSGECTVD